MFVSLNEFVNRSLILLLPFLWAQFSSAHSYNIVELLGPDGDRAALLIKDNHELASVNDNLEELYLLKERLRDLGKKEVPTLVLLESMWMFGKKFTNENLKGALLEMRNIVAPKLKTEIPLKSDAIVAARFPPTYVDFALPLEIVSLKNEAFVQGESVDPRLPLLKLNNLLFNVKANKIKIKLSDIWDMVDTAERKSEEIYEMLEDCGHLDIEQPFYDTLEYIQAEMTRFKLLFEKALPRTNPRVGNILTNKNIKKIFSNTEYAALRAVIKFDDSGRCHAWSQDIFTIAKVISPDQPKVLVIVGGGLHLDLLQSLLMGAGYTEVKNSGCPTEEILQASSASSCLSTHGINIDAQLKSTVNGALKKALVSFIPSEEGTGTKMPVLDVHGCQLSTCDQNAPMCCSQCRKVYYCSVACQRADWANHKLHCNK